ncbi:MAG: hypothetical protein JKY65_13955 [Planctomycetes bacterium]|nr:hypothetical protein [Planctomycetota bacterium]
MTKRATRSRPKRTSVKVRCAYCHDDLGQRDRRFCAGCMSAHHADCWEEHGMCSASGCEELEWVVPSERERKPRRAKKRRPKRHNATLARITNDANTALILGVVAVMACGLVGPFAIMKANTVTQTARQARLPVPGAATAGLVLGWIGTVGVLLGIGLMVLQLGMFATI